jgi:hypothetical protein
MGFLSSELASGALITTTLPRSFQIKKYIV